MLISRGAIDGDNGCSENQINESNPLSKQTLHFVIICDIIIYKINSTNSFANGMQIQLFNMKINILKYTQTAISLKTTENNYEKKDKTENANQTEQKHFEFLCLFLIHSTQTCH